MMEKSTSLSLSQESHTETPREDPHAMQGTIMDVDANRANLVWTLLESIFNTFSTLFHNFVQTRSLTTVLLINCGVI
jgi:hypothetical protein